nr:MAG TPA: hypothetical protein [Crassvirales sp.]
MLKRTKISTILKVKRVLKNNTELRPGAMLRALLFSYWRLYI